MRVAFGVSVLARTVQQGGVDGIGTYTRELMAATAPVRSAFLVVP